MTDASLILPPFERPLSEVARHVVIPEGIVDSVWFDLEDRFDEWGISWDVWQDGLGQIMLGTREDGKYAATVGGVTMSIVRQVAKTYIVSRTVFGLCTLFPESTWLWTAHRTRTMTQTFQKLAGFTQRKSVKPYLKANRNDGIRSSNGEQEIRFRNDSVILFGAREQGFGRGFDEVDGEVFDEAQILSERALDDMVPAANQSRNPHGALLIYMGTPPRPDIDPGEVFKSRRKKALDGKPDGEVVWVHGNAVYVETSADPNVGKPGGPGLDDPAQIAKANPSYPHRTPQESIDRMRENLTSDESWLREGLGVWDDDELALKAFRPSSWNVLIKPKPADGVKCFGVKFTPDGTTVALGAGIRDESGSVHVEGIRQENAGEGLGWLSGFLADRFESTSLIVIDGKAGTGALVQALKDAGVNRRGLVLVPSLDQYAQAHSMLLEAVKSGTLSHRGQAALDDQVFDAVKRPLSKTSGAFGWAASDGGMIPLLDAVTLAFWAAKTTRVDLSASRSAATARRAANTRRGR